MWRWWGSGIASFGLLGMLTYGFWADVWCRLGPAETYAVLGTVMYLAAGASLLRGSSCGRQSAVTSLEHPPARRFRCDRQQGEFSAALALHLGIGGLAALATQAGHDRCLGNAPVDRGGVDHRLFRDTCVGRHGTRHLLPRRRHSSPPASVDRLGSCACAPGRRQLCGGRPADVSRHDCLHSAAGQPPELRPWLARGGLALLLLAVLFASQYFFYNGNWPGNSRYDFPGLLVLPLMGLSSPGSVWPLSLASTPAGWRAAGRIVRDAGRAHGFPRLCGVAQPSTEQRNRHPTILPRPRQCRGSSPKRNQRRRRVFISHQVGDIEPVGSVRRFLRARQVGNPLFLRLAGYDSAKAVSPQDRQMTQYLEHLSQCGDGEQQPVVYWRNPDEHFQPLPRCRMARLSFQVDFLPSQEFRLNRGTFCNKSN